MDDATLKKAATLALCRALPDITRGVKQGRLSNLYRRLTREVDRELLGMRVFNPNAIRLIGDTIDDFQEASGWVDGSRRHIATYVNFLLAALDEIDGCAKVRVVLQLIFDYFERDDKVPAATLWAGAQAADKLLNAVAER